MNKEDFAVVFLPMLITYSFFAVFYWEFNPLLFGEVGRGFFSYFSFIWADIILFQILCVGGESDDLLPITEEDVEESKNEVTWDDLFV